MSSEGHIAAPPSRNWLLSASGLALIGASAIAVLFVLPAEFRIDPVGFGRVSGLLNLAGPKLRTAAEAVLGEGGTVMRFNQGAFRSDVVEIPLRTIGAELEYKVRINAGGSLIYSWTAEGLQDSESLYYDFHGESRDGPEGHEPVVEEYRQRTGEHDAGVLIPSLSGLHGWFFQNASENPVVIRLHLSGFYELVPPGEYGNEAGILPGSAPKP